MAGASRGKNISIWVASVLLAALFLLAGGMKLAGGAEPVAAFTRYGYPGWFRILIGATEVIGGVLLLVPRLATYGAAALAVVMGGAVYTLLTNGEAAKAPIPLVVLLILAVVFSARRPELERV